MKPATEKKIGMRIALGILGVAGVILLIFLAMNWPKTFPMREVQLGVTYSDRYAKGLGLDPRATYLAILDDLRARKIRLPVYWDQIEPSPGVYDFTDLDWQVDEAAKRQAELILVVGQRVPRWPECFIPAWAQQSDTVRKEALVPFIQKVVERYREKGAVKIWQVENEPFLNQRFGICPELDVDLLDREIATVRAADGHGRPILTTDSGELSIWYQAAVRGDMFGTTLYRDLWHPRFSYLSYPFSPSFFLIKKWIIETFAHQKHSIVIELQAEPWANGWIGNTPLAEQFITMDEHKLVANINYARQLGMPEIYLWGVEWWYWLKEKQNYPAVWETARELFRSS